MLGNNPFSIALPAGEERPIVLDMACSVAARGKIIVAAKDGTPIPDDWATGPDGQATTDPVEALKGFMLPVGGPKGYSLTLVIGLLSTMLSGAAFGSEVTDMYEDLERKQNIGHLFGVLPIACFEPLELTKHVSTRRFARYAACRVPRVWRESICPASANSFWPRNRLRSGIPIKQSVWAELLRSRQIVGGDLAELSWSPTTQSITGNKTARVVT